jgi:hypothetical protein
MYKNHSNASDAFRYLVYLFQYASKIPSYCYINIPVMKQNKQFSPVSEVNKFFSKLPTTVELY